MAACIIGSDSRMNFDRLVNAFTAHPATVGETYWQHLGMATSFGTRMILAGCACLLHGLLPWVFTRTGSDTIRALHERMVTQRSAARRTPDAAPATGAQS